MPKYNEAAIQFCLAITDLFNLALRQAMSVAQSLLQLSGRIGRCVTLVPLAGARSIFR